MKLIYYSITGNTKKIARKIADYKYEEITPNLIVDEDFVIITSSTGFGLPQDEVKEFLENNRVHLKGVIGSGNRNWGRNFCKGSKRIAEHFNVPYLYSVELAGNTYDIARSKKKIEELISNE